MSADRAEFDTTLHTPTGDGEPDRDEPVTFSATELRDMEADGLTLGAAVRALEARPG